MAARAQTSLCTADPLMAMPLILSKADGLITLQSLAAKPSLLRSSAYRIAVDSSSMNDCTVGLTGGKGDVGVDMGNELVELVVVVVVARRHA